MDIIREIFNGAWKVLNESAFYIIVGFFFAGLINFLISPKSIAKHLGGENLTSVFYASILGIPLPLCSCSVIPTAFNLKKSGASKGAVVSFLVSTPETGADSIFITYALMDPILTVARPLSAFFTAIIAGTAELFFGPDDKVEKSAHSETSACSSSCCGDAHPKKKRSIIKSITYAFTDLYKDIYFSYFLGVLIAGIIYAVIPDNLLSDFAVSDTVSMLTMLMISVPLYMCATSSTPIAAALILKGLSPGAAVVFLLAGPATNIVTLTVLSQNLGKKSTALYLSSIITCSLLAGYVINWIYSYYDIDISALSSVGGEVVPEQIKVASSLLLLIFSLYIFISSKVKKRK